LTSKDSEDAQNVAEHIIDEIRRVGADKIIQVVTDTCSVMKAAWKIIEKEFPHYVSTRDYFVNICIPLLLIQP
jgi:hypothetical protein